MRRSDRTRSRRVAHQPSDIGRYTSLGGYARKLLVIDDEIASHTSTVLVPESGFGRWAHAEVTITPYPGNRLARRTAEARARRGVVPG